MLPQQPNGFYTINPQQQLPFTPIYPQQFQNPQVIPQPMSTFHHQQIFHLPQINLPSNPIPTRPLPSTQQFSTSTAPNFKENKSKHKVDQSERIPEREDFCANWQSCSETKDFEHRCTKRHLCTIKDCSKTTEKVHVGRFLHNCKYGEKCRHMSDDNHNHNFIHPCRYKGECRKMGDIMHRIFFTHPASEQVSNSEFPSSWGKVSSDHFKIVKLAHQSNEFKEVEKRFIEKVKHSHSSAKVIDIERVENSKLWKSFALKKSEVIHKNSHLKPEDQVKTLYHGADETAISSITKNGFDYRLCTVGHFGSGNYFAINSSYSHGYTTLSNNGDRKMLVCKVVVGESLRVSKPDKTLRRPQDKLTGKMYDSVQAGATGTEYVLFDNESPYPEFIVTYQ